MTEALDMLKRRALIDALWLAVLGWYIVAGAGLAPFHGDESTLIFMGSDYFYLFEDGELDTMFYDGDWRVRPMEQHLRLVNGTISKTIYGWLASMQGKSAAELNTPWSWSRDIAANIALGRVPDTQLLHAARIASALQLALATVCFFAFVKLIFDRPTAYLASAFFALHPAILLNGRRAMMEGSHLLGMMLVLLAAAWLLRGRRPWQFVMLGMLSGLAIAAKHPNAFVVALVFIAVALTLLIDAWRARKPEHLTRLGWLAASGVLALLVFIALNPAWWRDPVDAAFAVLHERFKVLGGQVELFGGYESGLDRIEGLFHYGFAAPTQYFEAPDWASFPEITTQIAEYEASIWLGVSLGGGVPAGLLELILAALGVAWLLRDKAILRGHRVLLLVWGMGIAAIILVTTPLPWLRYYLPLLPAVMALSAYAIVRLARLGAERFKAHYGAAALLA